MDAGIFLNCHAVLVTEMTYCTIFRTNRSINVSKPVECRSLEIIGPRTQDVGNPSPPTGTSAEVLPVRAEVDEAASDSDSGRWSILDDDIPGCNLSDNVSCEEHGSFTAIAPPLVPTAQVSPIIARDAATLDDDWYDDDWYDYLTCRKTSGTVETWPASCAMSERTPTMTQRVAAAIVMSAKTA